jgi:hypothetical protein
MDTQFSAAAVYEEHQSFRLLNIITVVVAAVLLLTVYLTGANPLDMDPEALISTLAAIGIAALALWGFSRLSVTVTATEFQFGFPIWHRKMPLSQIQVGAVVHIPFWYGIGVHYIRGMWVYNAKLGRGLEITVGGKRYLIGSDQPERLQAALFDRLGGKRK